jgi:pimeloyl-ACP methyl ester carboxylesterase
MRFRRPLATTLLLGLMGSGWAAAQDPKPGTPGSTQFAAPRISAGHVGSSPFTPPDSNDSTFVVDQGGGLDTGCTFRGGGPLVFTIKVGRVVGNVQTLKQNGLIGATAELTMPAYDIDFNTVVPPYSPERDRVTFNGHVVPTEFLTGSNDTWKLNSFKVPIEWVNFPSDPGNGGTVTLKDNTIQIDIDTANSAEVWCTSIDWAALKIKVVRPVVMVHGIFSSSGVWSDPSQGAIWVNKLNQLGILNDGTLDLGWLHSIQRNATVIANEVAKAKQRWGVDKVNLVTHSKGGLDSREYVEGHKDVEQVIQLGTPNAGSPLADAIRKGKVTLSYLLGGLLNGSRVNRLSDLTLPAGKELTTWYMKGYNQSHGHNPKVQYTALAGIYSPGSCIFSCWLDRFLIWVVGQGDTIVPVSSVYSLPYTHNLLPIRSVYPEFDASHTRLEKSEKVFGLVYPNVRAFGSASALQASPETLPISGTATTGNLIQTGQVQTLTVPVDPGAPIYFTLLYGTGDLTMTLISPSGQQLDTTSSQFGKSDIPGGFMEVYRIEAPEAGDWTVTVTGTSAPDGVPYAVNAWFDTSEISLPSGGIPGIVLTSAVPNPNVHAGEPLVVAGALRKDGVPLLGAAAQAIVEMPDGTTHLLPLHDDGLAGDTVANDGIYSGQLTETSQPGNYEIALQTFGTALSVPSSFSREAYSLVTVSRSSSSFAGSYRDHGLDTDGDGLFDQFLVDANLNVTDAGHYRIFGVLSDTEGNTHEASVVTDLPAGPATVTLSFDGEEIFTNRVNGPYTLSTIRLVEEGDILAEEEGIELLPVASQTDAFRTAAYDYHQFQHAPILLTGGGSSMGIDTNDNGLYDLLKIDVGVEVDSAGYYSWSASLVDGNGRELGFVSNDGYLEAGPGQLELYYDGQAIGTGGVDGPYYVRDLLVYGAGHSLIVNDAFTTDAFLASQFEGYSLDHTPPALTVTLSPVVLWPPNHQLQEVDATITVTDDKDPNPTVRLVSITSSEPDNGLGDGDTPNDIQQADLGTDDRQFLLRAERSGTGPGRTYMVTYEARDAAGNTSQVSVKVVAPHDRPH